MAMNFDPFYFTDTMDVCLADHCSLKCKNCSHFSPFFTEPSFYSFDSFKKDVAALIKVYRAKKLRFLGGQPLLHPEAEKFFEFAKASGGFKRLDMITNGLALNRFDFSKYKDLNRVQLSVYSSVKFDYIKALTKFEEMVMQHKAVYWDIRHAFLIHHRSLNANELKAYNEFKEGLIAKIKGTVFRLDGQPLCEPPEDYFRISVKYEDKFRNITPETKLTKAEATESYAKCSLKRTCNQIHNGYFYKCPRPQNMKAYPNVEGQEFEKTDGIPLHEPNLKGRMRDYMESKVPLDSCYWCTEGLEPVVYEEHSQYKGREHLKKSSTPTQSVNIPKPLDRNANTLSDLR